MLLFFAQIIFSRQRGIKVNGCKQPAFSYLSGVGYDLFKGSPNSAHADPGYKTSYVIDYTFENCNTSPDGLWTIPDNFVAVQHNSDCQQSVEVDSSYNSQSWVENSEKQIDLNLHYSEGPLSVGFSLSADFQSNYETQSTDKSVTTSSTRRCTAYTITTMIFSAIPDGLSSDYLKAIKYCYDYNDFTLFFNSYGTHFATDIIMGGRVQQSSYFYEYDYQEMLSREQTVSIGADVTYCGWSGGLDGKSEQDMETGEYFNSTRYTYSNIMVGGLSCAQEKPWDDMASYKKCLDQDPAVISSALIEHPQVWDLAKDVLVESGIDYDELMTRYNQSLQLYCESGPFDCIMPVERTAPPQAAYVDWSTMVMSDIAGKQNDKDRTIEGCQKDGSSPFIGMSANLKIRRIEIICYEGASVTGTGAVDWLQFTLNDGGDGPSITQSIGAGKDGKYYFTNLAWNEEVGSIVMKEESGCVNNINFVITNTGSGMTRNFGCGSGKGSTVSPFNVPKEYRLFSFQGCWGRDKRQSRYQNVNWIQFQAWHIEHPEDMISSKRLQLGGARNVTRRKY